MPWLTSIYEDGKLSVQHFGEKCQMYQVSLRDMSMQNNLH